VKSTSSFWSVLQGKNSCDATHPLWVSSLESHCRAGHEYRKPMLIQRMRRRIYIMLDLLCWTEQSSNQALHLTISGASL
jgi:hypothetical protein